MKTKRCKCCKQMFEPSRPMQSVCSPLCAHSYAMQAKEKLNRKADKERREKLKTRRDYINEAQREFNAYIRQRDSGRPCICCGLALGNASVGGGFDAGHYRSVGSAPHLRFDDRNCHGQRKQCNRYGAGRAVDYRIGLIARIGLEDVEALEADNAPAKWTIDELKAIKSLYKQKLKTLKEADHA